MDTLTKLILGGLAFYGLDRILKTKDPQRTFFSFQYSSDIWRVNAVRNSWIVHKDPSKAGFFDHSLWERTRTIGDDAVMRLIDRALEDSEVTVVLIGERTHESRWVRYEIEQSLQRNNALLGVYIDNIRDARGRTSPRGPSPFDDIELYEGGPTLAPHIPHYDWINEDGYTNLSTWLVKAPRLSDITDDLGIELADDEDDEDDEDDA